VIWQKKTCCDNKSWKYFFTVYLFHFILIFLWHIFVLVFLAPLIDVAYCQFMEWKASNNNGYFQLIITRWYIKQRKHALFVLVRSSQITNFVVIGIALNLGLFIIALNIFFNKRLHNKWTCFLLSLVKHHANDVCGNSCIRRLFTNLRSVTSGITGLKPCRLVKL